MRKLLLLCLALMIASAGFSKDVGAKVDSINITMHIDQSLNVKEEININVYNEYNVSSSYFYIYLNDKPNSIVLLDENGTKLNYSVFVVNNIYTIRVEDEINASSSKSYLLRYSNNDIIKKFDNTYSFNYFFVSYYNLKSFSLSVFLPKGYGITKKEGNTILPPTSRIFSDGQQIIIEWKEEASYLSSFNFTIFFERIAISSFSIFHILLFTSLGFLAGAGVTYSRLKSKSKKIITMALSKDEKLVFDYIMEHKEVKQRDICEALDFSKAKTSKIIHNLEKKNIIIVMPQGRNNSILINNDVF